MTSDKRVEREPTIQRCLIEELEKLSGHRHNSSGERGGTVASQNPGLAPPVVQSIIGCVLKVLLFDSSVGMHFVYTIVTS